MFIAARWGIGHDTVVCVLASVLSSSYHDAAKKIGHNVVVGGWLAVDFDY